MNVKKPSGIRFPKSPILFSLPLLASVISACGDGSSQSLPRTCTTQKVSGLAEIGQAGRFLLKIKPAAALEVGQAEVESLAVSMADEGAAEVESVTEGLYAVKADTPAEAAELARQMGDLPEVQYVEPDHVVQGFATFNDPSASKQWAHGVIQSAKAWDISRGSKEIVVGVIDSGIDYTHPDLKDNMWHNPGEIDGNGKDDDKNGYVDDIYGWDFHNGDRFPMADDTKSYHGTHVAGTIGGVGGNGIGITGHAPTVKLMGLKFLGNNGSGYTSNAVKAIDYAVKKGVNILNNSWGGSSYNSSLYSAIGRAQEAGVLFVAAAGNNGGNYAIYPANYNWKNILVVAATTSADKLASFSNYHSETVDIGAPGYNIYSTRNGSTYAYLSGTSMATPLVSGVAALMMALRPDVDASVIKDILISTVDKNSYLTGKSKSDGRINAYKAMQAVQALPGDGGSGGGGGGTDPGTDPGESPGPDNDPSPENDCVVSVET